MTKKGTTARIHLATRGQWGRYEYSLVDFDWDTHRDAARHCNDEVGLRTRSNDLECRMHILKDAVRRMERALSDRPAA
jgi:hypothetical protein